MSTPEVPLIRRGVYAFQLYQEIFELRELGPRISVIDQPYFSGSKCGVHVTGLDKNVLSV